MTKWRMEKADGESSHDWDARVAKATTQRMETALSQAAVILTRNHMLEAGIGEHDTSIHGSLDGVGFQLRWSPVPARKLGINVRDQILVYLGSRVTNVHTRYGRSADTIRIKEGAHPLGGYEIATMAIEWLGKRRRARKELAELQDKREQQRQIEDSVRDEARALLGFENERAPRVGVCTYENGKMRLSIELTIDRREQATWIFRAVAKALEDI